MTTTSTTTANIRVGHCLGLRVYRSVYRIFMEGTAVDSKCMVETAEMRFMAVSHVMCVCFGGGQGPHIALAKANKHDGGFYPIVIGLGRGGVRTFSYMFNVRWEICSYGG